MQGAQNDPWIEELGLHLSQPPVYFRGIDDLNAVRHSVPQAHAIRRAFEELELDGVLCIADAPAAYFKFLETSDPTIIRELHRRAWNQGLAPVLVVVTPHDVLVFSGVITPAKTDDELSSDGRLIQTLNRVVAALEVRRFVLGLETGEYFRIHARSFDRERRVDRQLLVNLGEARRALSAIAPNGDRRIPDALLCRVVFTCYLTDCGIVDKKYFDNIGAQATRNVRELLEGKNARKLLYALFEQLQEDFNGDLFDADLKEEAKQIDERHIAVLRQLLRGDRLSSGQQALGFWAYDFSIIPIETISAIYEGFLRAESSEAQRRTGAYYTPRFLAEVVIDTALDGLDRWGERRFLDPACGSGIFLVGLFHRLAEEWRRRNPDASYEEHVEALIKILREQIVGIDFNGTACRIAAFSLYIALLDELSPPTIRKLQARKRWLPRLVFSLSELGVPGAGRTVLNADFAEAEKAVPYDGFDVVIGNPPWVSRSKQHEGRSSDQEKTESPLLRWCAEHELPIPQHQLAMAFVWKAGRHVRPNGRVCFLLPHSMLFNHDPKALAIQKAWLRRHPPDRVINLADLRFLLFEGPIKPALIVRYRGGSDLEAAEDESEDVEYYAPKVDYGVLRAEFLVLAPEDRSSINLRHVLLALEQRDSPSVWKERSWGSPRDWKFLARLNALPPLEENVDQPRRRRECPPADWKRWIAGQGFQPLGEKDDPRKGKAPWPPGTRFLQADDPNIALLLRPEDCSRDANSFGRLRRRPGDEIFKKPHVIVSKGLRVAYADFDMVFRHAVQAIHGPPEDEDLLIFLAVYLRSPLAHYYFFHTATNLGAERPEVHLAELLKAPFPFPATRPSPRDARALVRDVAKRVKKALRELPPVFGRSELVDGLQDELLPNVEAYFEVDNTERALIEDTIEIASKSATPRRSWAESVPALRPASEDDVQVYLRTVCDDLNRWSSGGPRFAARSLMSREAGLGVVAVTRDGKAATSVLRPQSQELDYVLGRMREHLAARRGSIHLVRGAKVFVGSTLYVLKPLTKRFWTKTAALNDADEIFAAVLSAPMEVAGPNLGLAVTQG